MTTACQVVGACEQLQIATYVRTYVRASDLLGWGNRERLLLPFLTLLLGRAELVIDHKFLSSNFCRGL